MRKKKELKGKHYVKRMSSFAKQIFYKTTHFLKFLLKQTRVTLWSNSPSEPKIGGKETYIIQVCATNRRFVELENGKYHIS